VKSWVKSSSHSIYDYHAAMLDKAVRSSKPADLELREVDFEDELSTNVDLCKEDGQCNRLRIPMACVMQQRMNLSERRRNRG
jgi:hypothetical protein